MASAQTSGAGTYCSRESPSIPMAFYKLRLHPVAVRSIATTPIATNSIASSPTITAASIAHSIATQSSDPRLNLTGRSLWNRKSFCERSQLWRHNCGLEAIPDQQLQWGILFRPVAISRLRPGLGNAPSCSVVSSDKFEVLSRIQLISKASHPKHPWLFSSQLSNVYPTTLQHSWRGVLYFFLHCMTKRYVEHDKPDC